MRRFVGSEATDNMRWHVATRNLDFQVWVVLATQVKPLVKWWRERIGFSPFLFFCSLFLFFLKLSRAFKNCKFSRVRRVWFQLSTSCLRVTKLTSVITTTIFQRRIHNLKNRRFFPNATPNVLKHQLICKE